jgi:hypothetical protein
VQLVNKLKETEQLPVVTFAFSKKRCAGIQEWEEKVGW